MVVRSYHEQTKWVVSQSESVCFDEPLLISITPVLYLQLDSVISAMMKSLSSSQQNEVKAWEEEIVACDHTRHLKQLGEGSKPGSQCGKCDLPSNLWLCLTCGNLGCGRAQFGGVGGNSHGLAHFEETGHPVSVKQGTITAEGTADIYCYACNDARIDPELATHLRHFGMNVMDLSKTEKSMTELQLEQNLKFDFNMTGEDGKELQPLFGAGLTGLRNLGNSCYLASVVQSLFAFPAFQARYGDAYRPHTTACANPLPASCLECQLDKLADGLLSGRYSVPRPSDQGAAASSDAAEADRPIFQAGIKPAMFKALVGKGHEEFATMRQQDADEFFKHIVSAIQKESRRLTSDTDGSAPTNDPTTIFSFGLQQRLQCTQCRRVRYTVEAQDAGLSLPVPLRVKAQKAASDDPDVASAAKAKGAAEGVNAEAPASKALPNDKVEYEPVTLSECLDIFTSPEVLSDYQCPSCNTKVEATKQTLFTTFPDVLAVQVRRFQLVNWVPQKVDVPIVVPVDSTLDLSKYLGTGKREDEEELPEPAVSSEGASNLPQFDAGAMSTLTAMGFPEVRAQKALLATGNTGDAEAAMTWLFSHMEDPDIDDPIDFSKHSASSAAASSGGPAAPDTSALEDMGFSTPQARKALRVNNGNAEIAVAWLFENPDDPGESEEEATSGAVGAGEGTSSGADASQKSVIGGDSKLPASYALKSFVSHKGPSVHSGHYVAHIRKGQSMLTGVTGTEEAVKGDIQMKEPAHSTGDGEEQEWVFFNDEKVVKAPLTSTRAQTHGEKAATGDAEASADTDDGKDDVGVMGLSKLAYLYFFERK